MELLNKLLEKLGQKEKTPDVLQELSPPSMEVPPTPFFIGHVPKLDSLASTPGKMLYQVDKSTINKQRFTGDPIAEAELRERFKHLPLNVGVGPYPTARHQNKGNKVYQYNPRTVRLAKGE